MGGVPPYFIDSAKMIGIELDEAIAARSAFRGALGTTIVKITIQICSQESPSDSRLSASTSSRPAKIPQYWAMAMPKQPTTSKTNPMFISVFRGTVSPVQSQATSRPTAMEIAPGAHPVTLSNATARPSGEMSCTAKFAMKKANAKRSARTRSRFAAARSRSSGNVGDRLERVGVEADGRPATPGLRSVSPLMTASDL